MGGAGHYAVTGAYLTNSPHNISMLNKYPYKNYRGDKTHVICGQANLRSLETP
jgi:hypothetical protein